MGLWSDGFYNLNKGIEDINETIYKEHKAHNQWGQEHPVADLVINTLLTANPITSPYNVANTMYDIFYATPRMQKDATETWERNIEQFTEMHTKDATRRKEFEAYIRDAEAMGYIDGSTSKDALAAFTKLKNSGYDYSKLSSNEIDSVRKLYGELWNNGEPKFTSYWNDKYSNMTDEEKLNFLGGMGGMGLTSIPAPAYIDGSLDIYQKQVEPLKLYSNKEFADLMGIDYNYDNIRRDIEKAANAEVKYQNWQSDLLKNVAERDNSQTLASYLDSIRNIKSQAIQQGVSNGARASAELLANLNNIQTKGANELETAGSRFDTMNDALLNRAKVDVNALDYYDKLGQMLGGNVTQLYNNDVDRYGMDLLSNAVYDSSDRNWIANRLSANAQMEGYNSYANAQNAAAQGQAQGAYNYFRDITLPAILQQGGDFRQALSNYIDLAYTQGSGYADTMAKWGAMSKYGNK